VEKYKESFYPNLSNQLIRLIVQEARKQTDHGYALIMGKEKH